MAQLKILSGASILLYSCDYGDGIAIGFNEGRHFLISGKGDYSVFPFHSPMLRVTCELIPYKRENLKLDDTAFCTTSGLPDPECICDYCKIIDEDRIIFINSDDDIQESNADLSHFNWYKVVPVK